MSVHDAVLEYQAQVVALIEVSPNRRAACRRIGIHHSTFYRWRARGQRPVSARRRRWRDLERDARVVAVALAHPGYGPQRLSFELARVSGVAVSASTVWRILRAHRLNTRALRYQLMTARGVELPTVVRQVPDRPVGVLHADRPGDLVQLDCFHVGSFKETRLGRSKATHGQIWQYTAIDVPSSFLWAELHTSRWNPDPVHTSALAYRVATDLTRWGHTWQAASTDNGNEYRSHLFRDTLEGLGVEHRFIRAGRPQSNGKGRTSPRHPVRRALQTCALHLCGTLHQWPPPRPHRLPHLLQLATTPHRQMEPRPNPSNHHQPQTNHHTMNPTRRTHREKRHRRGGTIATPPRLTLSKRATRCRCPEGEAGGV